MKKRVFCLVCALLLALLPGCSLARDGQSTPIPARLIGSYVTFEWVGSGGQVEGKIDNSDPLRPRITFDGMEGIPIFCYPVEEEGKSVVYVGSEDPRVFDPRTAAHVGGGLTYEATLTALADRGSLYYHRLYRRPDGSVYLITDIGTGFGDGEGSIFFREEDPGPASSWSDGPWSGSFTVHLKTQLPIDRYVLCHMTADNRELKRETYLPGQLPDTLEMAGDWLLVEEWQAGPEGPVVQRHTIPAQTGALTTLALEKTGLFCQIESTLSWPFCEKVE